MRADWLSRIVLHSINPLVLAALVLVTGFLLTHLILRTSSLGRFLCQAATFVGLTVTLIIAHVTPFEPTPVMNFNITFLTIIAFKMIWWMASAWLIAGLVRAAFVMTRQPVETRFLQDLFAGFVYVGAVLGIVAYVFNIPINGVLAASGVVAIVLGLALQSTLSDLFSGVVLNMAKPYHRGDWVMLGGGLEGNVVETNWRATQILTRTNGLAIVPNSVIAKASLLNASRPTEVHGLTITVRLDATIAPLTAVQLLEMAMLSCDSILRVPTAKVAIRRLDAIAVECDLTFFVESVEEGPAAQNEVFDRVFRHCTSAGIGLAPPAESAATIPLRNTAQKPEDIPRRLLERLPVFLTLTDEERLTLAPKMHRRSYKGGETLVEQGAAPPALLILTSGVLAALQRRGTAAIEIFRLAPGDCFALTALVAGGKSPFTFKAVTKVVVYEISKEDIAPILQKWPSIAAALNQALAGRIAAAQARLAELDDDHKHVRSLTDRLSARIRLALGLV